MKAPTCKIMHPFSWDTLTVININHLHAYTYAHKPYVHMAT